MTSMSQETKRKRQPILEVKELQVSFKVARGTAQIIAGVDFQLYPQEILALVGETGSGKSVTAKSLLRLLPRRTSTTTGSAIYNDTDLLSLSDKALQAIRGNGIGMIFQNPQACINPVFTLGEQLFRLIRLYLGQEIALTRSQQGLSEKAAIRQIARQKLREVGLSDSDRVFKSYVSQVSGGMAQRYMIALALLASPDILIADEATSALDVTVQARILKLLQELCRINRTAVLFITHDLGIAAQVCDRVAVMYSGRIVELADTDEIFARPRHPYTRGLLAAVPRPGRRKELSFIPGMVPDLTNPPQGCRFHPRCPECMEICRKTVPSPSVGHGGEVSCHLYRNSEEARG